MDFNLTEEHKIIAHSAREIAKKFGPEYWREKEKKKEFAGEFWKVIGDAGFTRIVIPEECGEAEKGITELLIAMEELAANGCGMGWCVVSYPD